MFEILPVLGHMYVNINFIVELANNKVMKEGLCRKTVHANKTSATPTLKFSF